MLKSAFSSLIALLAISSSAKADGCIEVIQSKGFDYKQLNQKEFVVLSYQGQDFVYCNQGADSNWTCGDKKFTIGMGRAIDKSGNDWPISWEPDGDQVVCYEKGNGKYQEIERDRYKGVVISAGINLIKVSGWEKYYEEIRPNF